MTAMQDRRVMERDDPRDDLGDVPCDGGPGDYNICSECREGVEEWEDWRLWNEECG